MNIDEIKKFINNQLKKIDLENCHTGDTTMIA